VNDELRILSFYRASELTGAVLCGRLALHTECEELRAPLTGQCAEEAEHAWAITKLITEMGHVPLKVKETFQTAMARELGLPTTAVEILALTEVLETRVMDHYRRHAELPGADPRVVRTLRRMVDQAAGHAGWVDQELDRYRGEYGDAAVDQAMSRAREADRHAFEHFAADPTYIAYFGAAP
jgi:hypothetical protein